MFMFLKIQAQYPTLTNLEHSRRCLRKSVLSDIFVYQPAFCLSILYFVVIYFQNLRCHSAHQGNLKCKNKFWRKTVCIELQVVGGLVTLCYGGRCCSRCSASFIVLSFLFGLGRSIQAAKQGNFSRPFCLLKCVYTI